MTNDEQKPQPGSDAAVERGCRCPRMDNAHGAGYMGSGDYWINADYPLHGEGE